MSGQRYSRQNNTGDTEFDGRVIDLSSEMDRPQPDDLLKGIKPTLDTFRYPNYDAVFKGEERPLTGTDLLKVIAKVQYDRFTLETLGNAFTPFIFQIGITPTLILPPNKSPRGYLFLNPSQFLTGATLDTNMFTPLVRGAGTYLSNAINVQGFATATFFLNITASPATMQVNVQSRDPQTLNWATVQTDIFSGAVAAGTYQATIGSIGVDDFIRLQVITTGAAENWSITMVNKGASGTTVSAPGIFLGNANVQANFGYPILGGQEKRFWLMDNTPLFAIGLVPGVLSVFQLQ